MRKKQITTVIYGVFILMFFSCTGSRSYVSFEILEPSPITYPESVHSVGFLNRTPLNMNAFSDINKEKMDRMTLRIIDSIICNSVIKGFSEGIRQADLSYMQNIQIFERRRPDTTGRKLESDQMFRQELFRDNDIDALVSFEYYHVQVERSYSSYSIHYGEFIQEYRLVMELFWRVYAEGLDKPLDTFRQYDTLYYTNRASQNADEYRTGIDVVRDGSKGFGYAYGIRQTPLWNEIFRVIFSGMDPSLERAAEFTDKGDWETAKEIWSANLKTIDKSKLKGKSAHNLAVYYEMQDDLETALLYAQQADSLWSNWNIESLRQDLEIRVANKTDLLRQVR